MYITRDLVLYEPTWDLVHIAFAYSNFCQRELIYFEKRYVMIKSRLLFDRQFIYFLTGFFFFILLVPTFM